MWNAKAIFSGEGTPRSRMKAGAALAPTVMLLGMLLMASLMEEMAWSRDLEAGEE